MLPVLQEKRFGCTRCGNCCVQSGWVFFSVHEMEAMAHHLGLKLGSFKRRYHIEWDIDERRWAIDATDGTGCPLLTPDRKCSVHPVKPRQCSSFPFWSELLDTPDNWEATKSYCPGLDAPNGRLYSVEEMLAIQKGEQIT